MKIAVIVVNWNAGEALRRCLQSVAGQERRPDRVIVVDNASIDGSLEAMVREFRFVEAIRLGTNVGFAAANNLALKAAEDCDWVALLNPDAFPTPSWLASLEDASRHNPDCAVFASQLRSAADASRLDGAGDAYHVSGLVWREGYGRRLPAYEPPREVFSACAAAAFYRRDALMEIGGFDERYFCYVEDVDVGFRLRLRGHHCIYVPSAVAHHVGSSTTGRRSDFSTYHGQRNLVWTFFKNMPAPLLALYLPQHLLLNLVNVLRFTARGQGRAVLRAEWDALRGLPEVLRDRSQVQRTRCARTRDLRRPMARGWQALYRVWAQRVERERAAKHSLPIVERGSRIPPGPPLPRVTPGRSD
jgi:GT2 family glycosyltransferase